MYHGGMGVVVSGLPEFPLPDHVRGMFRKVLGGDMNYDGLITIDSEICRKDGLCVRVCPKVFTQTEPRAVPDVARPEFCNDCGHCLLVCPAGAIRHRNLEGRAIAEVEKDLLPSFRQVQEMVRSRRSIRNFLDRPVERELIEKVVDAARFAPTRKNTQSTRFIAVDNGRRFGG